MENIQDINNQIKKITMTKKEEALILLMSIIERFPLAIKNIIHEEFWYKQVPKVFTNEQTKEDFIIMNDTSSFLDISVETIYKLVRHCKILFHKTGEKYYYLISNLRKCFIEKWQKRYYNPPSESESLIDKYLLNQNTTS